MDIQTKFTTDLLAAFASHLSGRADCKGVPYKIHIDAASGSIQCSPNIQVYPSRYHRKPEDKRYIVEHLLRHHFQGILDLFASKPGDIRVLPNMLVSGTYVYELSADRKRRRWSKVSISPTPDDSLITLK